MKVTLISRPSFLMPERPYRSDQMQGPDAQKLIEFSGRVCYNSFGVGRNSDKYADNIIEVAHGSVLEHAQFSFLIEGVSRNLLMELTRHDVGTAYSVRSTRFCDEDDAPVVVHPLAQKLFGEDTDLAASFELLGEMQRAMYLRVLEGVERNLKNVDRMTARKQARGAARICLSSALQTELVFSANVRSLRHIIEMRASISADAEIRLLGNAMLHLMRSELPAYFSDYETFDAPDGIGYGVETVYRKV